MKKKQFDLCQKILNNSRDRENLRAPEDEEVRKLCERIGYGAVMDSAARQWRRKDPVGALVIGPCIDIVVRLTLRPTGARTRESVKHEQYIETEKARSGSCAAGC